jgi:hypothetical protein
LERVKAEHDNLRAAMDWSLKNDAVMALRLVLACDALSGDSIREAELPIERALQNTEGASAALVGAVSTSQWPMPGVAAISCDKASWLCGAGNWPASVVSRGTIAWALFSWAAPSVAQDDSAKRAST